MNRVSFAFFTSLLGLAFLGAGCALFEQPSSESQVSSSATVESSNSNSVSENSIETDNKINAEDLPEPMEKTVENSKEPSNPDTEEKSDDALSENPPKDTIEPEEKNVEQIAYTGRVLSAGLSPVIEFNQSDYDKAIAANKIIVLTYYANWCPTCKKQEPEHFAGLSAINNPNVIAFRVNFKDSDTIEAEEDIARKYGISAQDTKVIIVNGERVVKTLNFWTSADYIAQIQAYL